MAFPAATTASRKRDAAGEEDIEFVLHTNRHQLVLGAAVGLLAGYMDNEYLEPFGLIFGGALAALQLVDFADVAKMPWNHPSGDNAVADTEEVGPAERDTVATLKDNALAFAKDNACLAATFIGGYYVGLHISEWAVEVEEAVEDSLGWEYHHHEHSHHLHT